MRKRQAFHRLVTTALTIVAALAVAACTDRQPPTGSGPGASSLQTAQASPGCQPSLRNRLEHAADGLLYTSESDFPFEFFCAPAQVADTLTAEAFRAIAGVAADAPFEEISVDDFFARHIERVDPNDAVAVALVPRYQELKEAVFETLHEPRVYRVGTIAIGCYVVGTDKRGNVAGLTTTSIET
jgi:hypothetical protein